MIETDIGSIPDPTERFFAYAREREAIRVRREVERMPRPYWTTDSILQRYRFCNVFREDDRTTRWFRGCVREPMRNMPEVLLATVLFRWFNRISTGEATFSQLCLYQDGFRSAWEEFLRTGKIMVLHHAIRQYCGDGPYTTGSYLIRSPAGFNKLRGILEYFDAFVRSGWRDMLPFFCSLEQAWEELRVRRGLGPFLAYEIVTDLRHTAILEGAPDIDTWANPGPGARRGLNRIHNRDIKLKCSDEILIKEMQLLLKLSRRMWPKKILGASVPRWELREVESTLCEYDKMERTRLGQGRPRQVLK